MKVKLDENKLLIN